MRARDFALEPDGSGKRLYPAARADSEEVRDLAWTLSYVRHPASSHPPKNILRILLWGVALWYERA